MTVSEKLHPPIKYAANGAPIIAMKFDSVDSRRVLCLWGTEYVIWRMDLESRQCESGRYFSDFDKAAAEFAKY